jgi:hypothetical protein
MQDGRMTLMKTRNIVFSAIWGIVLCCNRVSAAVVIQTESTSDLGASLSFNQFDTALGQLDEIVVNTASTLTSDGSFSNTGRTTATAQTILSGTYTVDLPNTSITSPTENINSGVLDIPSHQTVTWGPLSASTSTHNVFNLETDLVQYEGNGTFDVDADEIVNNSGFRTGTGSTMICDMACLDVTIYYCYTPVAMPEASTIWSGVAALGVICLAIGHRPRKPSLN